LVVIALTLGQFGIPEAGLVLLLGLASGFLPAWQARQAG